MDRNQDFTPRSNEKAGTCCSERLRKNLLAPSQHFSLGSSRQAAAQSLLLFHSGSNSVIITAKEDIVPGQSFRLGKIWGITIGVNASWFLVFALITFSLVSQFSAQHPQWSLAYAYIIGGFTSLLFFVSVLLHELGHSRVALQYHLPIRSITLFIFGGIAQLGKEPDRPMTELRIAIAGPLVSLVLSLAFGAVGSMAAGISEGLQTLGLWLGRINLNLALFNLLPGFPLDGGRVFRALVWNRTGDFVRATQLAGDMGRGVAFLLIFAGLWIGLSGALLQGLWLSFIGWFLFSAAETHVQQLTLKRARQDCVRGM